MVSLRDQLISEISLSNPELSPKEVSDQILILIQNEILPAAIASARFPNLPSPIRVRQEELFRRRARARVLPKRTLGEKVRFIQDLEKLRSQFDGSCITSEDSFLGLMNNTQMFFGREVGYDIKSDGKAVSVEPDIVQKRSKSSPSLEGRERKLKKPVPLVDFGSSIKERIVCDPFFEEIVGKLESRIRRNYDRETLQIFFNFSMRTDMDDPHREKIILRISLPSHTFDQKMDLWDKIEADIRDTIEKLDITDSERRAINRNLFTHIEAT